MLKILLLRPKRALVSLILASYSLMTLAAAPTAASEPPPALPVATLKLHKTQVPIQIEAVGQTEGASEVEVRARVGGIINKRWYQEGQAVKKGQILFQLDPVPFEIALAQAEAQKGEQVARLNQAVREAKRFNELFRQRAISQKEVDDANSQIELVKAALALSEAQLRQAQLNLSYTKVIAPVAGISGRAEHSEGSLVNAANDSLLTKVVQLNPIWARFSLSDSELAKVPGQQLSADKVSSIKLILASGKEYPSEGTLNFAASVLDPQLASLSLRAEFANADAQLLPGQFVRVRLTVGVHRDVFVVPQSAVLQGEQGHFVWLVKAGKATFQPVQVGEWLGADWLLKSGLNDGDELILDNLVKVRPGMAVSPLPAPAAH